MVETVLKVSSNTAPIHLVEKVIGFGKELINKSIDLLEDVNYAKIIISTNNLPTTDDKTIGFYRRWLIVDFPNQFSEQKDILNDIPEEEYNALALKCTFILKDLLEKSHPKYKQHWGTL
jgi:hypothetical protein